MVFFLRPHTHGWTNACGAELTVAPHAAAVAAACFYGCCCCCRFSLKTEDKFFDPDDMEKFADEGTTDDDLEGESRDVALGVTGSTPVASLEVRKEAERHATACAPG